MINSLSSIAGMNVIISELLPVVEIKYKFLWPIIGGHVWVNGVEHESDIFMIGNNDVVMTSAKWRTVEEQLSEVKP